MSAEELLQAIVANPSCVDDPAAWNFTKLKIAFEAIPEIFKKENPCVKMMPKVLRQWFTEYGPKLGAACGISAAPPPQQQQQQPDMQQQGMQQQQQGMQQQFDQMNMQQQGMPQQQMMQQPPQQFDQQGMGMQQQGMGMQPPMDNMGMGMQQQGMMNTMGGMGGMGGGFDPSQDPNAMMSMPYAKYNQIKERFNERDLELKQAHLQIQLMQLQIEKLEAENKMLKDNQWSGGGRQRANTENLFDM